MLILIVDVCLSVYGVPWVLLKVRKVEDHVCTIMLRLKVIYHGKLKKVK